MPLLRISKGLLECLLNALWKVYQEEEFGRKEIVLATLVDVAQVSIALRVFVLEHTIHLVYFQRRRILRICNANGELLIWRISSHVSTGVCVTFTLELFPSDTVRLVPV